MSGDGEWSSVSAKFANVDIKGSLPRQALDSSISATIERATLLDAPVNCEISASDIEVGKEIGKGAFGTVFRGKLHGKAVAVKKLHTQKMDESAQEDFKAEMQVMSKLRHPNVVLFMGACMEPDNVMMVTELMPRGSLYDILHNKSIQLSFKQKMKMAKDAALGMNWLHCSKPVFIHRDLKTHNLLVDENWTVKVGDFGLSHIKKHESSGKGGSYGSIGTPLWMAPEVLKNKEYDESVDVYSFGIVLWELYTQKDPFGDIDNYPAMVEAVVEKGSRPPIPKDCPKKLRKLIEICWDADPKKRPKFSQMIPAFDSIILEAVIRDENGRKLWKKYFLGEKLRDKVSWKNFTIALTSIFKTNLPKDTQDTRWKCLKTLLVDKSGKVSMEQFARILEWFGPMNDLTEFLVNIEGLLKRPWFHGEISSSDAEKKLTDEPKGTFLVRFSARDPGCYAISVVGSKNAMKHYRVHHRAGGPYVISNIECPKLEDFITTHGKSLGLKEMCPGSPFESIFVEDDTHKTGYEVPDF